MSAEGGPPQTPWKRKESSRDRSTDQFAVKTKANLSVDVEKAQSAEPPTLGSPTSFDDDGDDALLLRRRARAVMQLMTIGRLASQLQQRDCFELYIGGYADDFLHERNIIHTKVLPQVCRWCLDAGVEFDAVDMMHCTNDLLPPEPIDGSVCKREAIECCTKSTIGLKYIALIGNKVGPRPLPEKVSKSVLNEMLHQAATEEDKELVRSWYVADPLSFPPQYMLLSPLYAAQVMQEGADLDDLEPEDKLDAARNYVEIDKGLRRIVEAGLSAHYPELLPKSLLEQELDIFVGSASKGSSSPKGKSPDRGGGGSSQQNQCMMIVRTLRGIIESDPKAKSYLDLTAEGNHDADSAQLVDWLHTTGVQEYMGSAKNAVRGVLNWQSTGLSVHHPQFEPYFINVEERVVSAIKESLDQDLKTRTAQHLLIASSGADEGPPWLLSEIRAHVQHSQQLNSKFVLGEVDALVANLSRPAKGSEPTFLVGAVGCGKSSIIAQVAIRLCEQEHERAQAEGRQASLESIVSDRSELDSSKNANALLESPVEESPRSPLAVFRSSRNLPSDGSPLPPHDAQGNSKVTLLPRVIITRFCNISAYSRSARAVLASVVAQLKWIIANLGGGSEAAEEDELDPQRLSYEALVVNFNSLLREAGGKAHIIIMIDGLDECAPEHHPERNVDWIPARLPPNVRLLVSLAGSVSPLAKPDPYASPIQDACSQLVKDRLRDRQLHAKNVMEVAPIKSAHQKALTEHMLKTNGRRLTKEYETELGALGETSLMLFLSLCLRFMCWVKPSTDGESFKVPRSILSLLDTSFEILGGVHGEALTNWTLGFFCAAHPHGLTEVELLDLISCADDVFKEQADTGYTPPQKRVSRRQWAMLKDDLVALGFLFETSCHLGAAWSFSHVTIEAMVRERQVPEQTMIACLKNLSGLYSGKLKDTMGARIIMSCVDQDVLGPTMVQVPTLADKDGDADGKSVRSSESRCAVMQAGGGLNKRKLIILPAALIKLTALTGGAFADPLTALLNDTGLVERYREAGLGEDLWMLVAAAMRCISRLPVKRAMIERCLTRLAALVANNDLFCGKQTFGFGKGLAGEGSSYHEAGTHDQDSLSSPLDEGADRMEPVSTDNRPLTAQSIESMLSSQQELANGDYAGQGVDANKVESLGAPVLKIEQVKERLMEWEIERFTVVCMGMKQRLLDKSRDAKTASLAPVPTIPSVANLRIARQQDEEAAQAELKAGQEMAWTAQQVVEIECMRAGEPRFGNATIKQSLISFLKDHLVSLSQMQMLLLTRRHLAQDKTDYDAWMQAVAPQLDSIYQYKDYETLLLRNLESLEEGKAEEALEAAALVHLRWLVHRHSSRWPLDKLTTQLRWLHASRKAEIYRSVEEQGRTTKHRDFCHHEEKDGLVHFPSFLSPLVGCAYTTIGIMSLTDHELDHELEDLRAETGMEEEIGADDGFKFGNAVFSLIMRVVEDTATDFKRKDSSRSNQTQRGTWRKAMSPSTFVRTLHARYDAVVQASIDQMETATKAGKEDKVGGDKADIDSTLKALFEPLSQQRVTYVTSCIKDLVREHTPRLQEELKDPMKARAIKNAHANEDIVEGGKIKVDLSEDKLTSVYSLRIVSMRRARRRILAILNVFAIIQRQMELSAALLDAPSADADKILSEMMVMQHKLDIDSDGVVHAIDDDGENVIYDSAFNDLFQLESDILFSATQFCQNAERESIPEKNKALHDYFQCELALQEAKLRLVTALLDVLQHSTEISERRQNIQWIVDAMHARAPTNLSSACVTSTYHLKVSTLNLQAELLARVVGHQEQAERHYVDQIKSQCPPDATLAGFPLACVPCQKVAHTLATPHLSFRLFPKPPPPRPPPPATRPDLEEDLPPPRPSPAPLLSSLSKLHTRSEVLPSLGGATEVLQICIDMSEQLAAAFVGADAGITWLAFQYAVLEEGMKLVVARQELEEGGIEALTSMQDAEAGDNLSTSPVILTPPAQMSPIDNPVAIRTILETQRLDALQVSSIQTPERGGGGGSREFRGVCRALELVHRRWLLSQTLWEIEVVEKATNKIVRDFRLEETSKKKPAAAAAVQARADTDKDDAEGPPPCYFALGHEVDELSLPYLHLVGLKEKDLEIDFRGVNGVCALLKDPLARNSVSAQSAQKLGYVLQLALLRKQTVAVALEYNVTHLDALLALHNARLEDGKIKPQGDVAGNRPSPYGDDTDWRIRIDGSVAAPKIKKKPKLLRHSNSQGGVHDTMNTRSPRAPVDRVSPREADPPAGSTPAGDVADEDKGDKPVQLNPRSGGIAMPSWPALELLPPYRLRLLEALVSPDGLLRVAVNVATVPFAAHMSEKVERMARALCDELQLASLTVQSVKEAQLLRSFWLANQAVLSAPQDPLVLHEPCARDAPEKRKGPVLEEVRPGAVSLNLWRIPLAVEFFSSMCLDKAALKSYATACRALYDCLCFLKARALCAGESGAAVIDQMRRDVNKIRERIASNITGALVPPHIVAAYLVRMRNNFISAHLLVLRQARATLLQDDNKKAASLVRYMYYESLNALLSDKAYHLKGLPPFGGVDAERRRWGVYISRQDSCAGTGFLLQYLHVDERKSMERDFVALEKLIGDCLRTNNVYPERDMQKAADLQSELLADSTRLESIKMLLVYRIAGLREPMSAEELQIVKVTFDKFLRKVMSGNPEDAGAAAAVDDAPSVLSSTSEALEGEQSDVVTDVSSTVDDESADAAVLAGVVAASRVDFNQDAATGLDTGLRARVSLLQVEATLSFLSNSQHAARAAAASLLKGIEKLQRAARNQAAAISPLSPTGSIRSSRAGAGGESPLSPRRKVLKPTLRELARGGGAGGALEAVEVGNDRPEALWKEFLEGLGPLVSEEQVNGQDVEQAVVQVRIEKHQLFQLANRAALKLSEWMNERETSKGQALLEEVGEMKSKLRGAEQDGKFLDAVLERINEGTKRLTFQDLVDKYGTRLYQQTALSKSWDEMERRCMQHKYDTETRVQDEYDTNIKRTKDELSNVRGNLNNDCTSYSDMMNTEMVQICQDEKAAVKPMVNRRFQQMLLQDGPRKKSDGLKEAEKKERELRKECKELQHRLSLDVYFLRFKLCIRASHFEKVEHNLLAERHDYNKERYALQRQHAPLPRQLEAVTEKLEAVELELGSVSKELETINADKLDLLTSKVKINKAIEKIQKEYGFTNQETSDPRIAALERMAAIEDEIRKRQEEVHDLEEEQAAEASELLFGEAAEARIREAREALALEQEAKLWAYRQLDSHRKECETYTAVKDARDGGLLKSAFVESKTRVYEYWDQTLTEQNALLRAMLETHGLEVPQTAGGSRAMMKHASETEPDQSDTELPSAASQRPATPPDMRIRAPSSTAAVAADRVRAEKGGTPAVVPGPSPGGRKRRQGRASRGESLSAELSMSSIGGGSLSEPSLPRDDTGMLQAGGRSSVHRGLASWVQKEAAKMSSASFDVVRRNAPHERRVLLVKSGLDEPVTFSRAIDLGLTKRREGIGGTNENYTRLPPVKTPVKAKDFSPGGNLSAQQGGDQPMAGEDFASSIRYDAKGYPTKVDFSPPPSAVFTRVRRSLYP